MTDFFALLDAPRRPNPSQDAIARRFRELSGATHPDRFGNAPPEERRDATNRFATLNAANACLADPKARLSHLLELCRERSMEEVTAIPNDQADLFMDFNGLLKGADAFLENRDSAQTALQRAALMGEALEWTDRLQSFQEKITALRAAALNKVAALDQHWPTDPGAPPSEAQLDEAESLCRTLSYLGRWQTQIQDRLTRLAI